MKSRASNRIKSNGHSKAPLKKLRRSELAEFEDAFLLQKELLLTRDYAEAIIEAVPPLLVLDKKLRVQPLLTPDNYSDETLRFIRAARKRLLLLASRAFPLRRRTNLVAFPPSRFWIQSFFGHGNKFLSNVRRLTRTELEFSSSERHA